MKIKYGNKKNFRAQLFSRGFAFLIGGLAGLSSMSASSVEIAQAPLYIGSEVPGNLALVPSVEFPTVISQANLSPTYTAAGNFVGYFDSNKCYAYHYSDTESERHFYPVSKSATKTCASPNWSGNFLNWAATQTIDPFRAALTGGYRVRDTASETWLEKAFADSGQGGTGNFEHRRVSGSGVISGATPAQWDVLEMRILQLGNKMRFGGKATNVQNGTNLVAYNPAAHVLDKKKFSKDLNWDDVAYEVSVRVKVCDATVGLEANCVGYPNGQFKPEGLIQKYSSKIMYSAFSYQNVNGNSLDGGVLRANQKFVGPLTYYPEVGPRANPGREWDPATGILYPNPDAADAATTNAIVAAGGGTCGVSGGCVIRNSGVINYLNKFGQMNTGKSVKSQDNVSELYYAAVRYFKHLGDVPAYSQLTGDATNRYRRADGFPVITNWNEVVGGVRVRDPIRYQCQTNVILGIGDTNTWQDKNLPGAGTSGSDEPTKPQAVVDDTTVDVVEMMRKIWRMEGKSATDANTLATRNYFNNSGHYNSAYIAALAYDSHTRDIRPETRPNGFPGKQTISTHWVDVIEGRQNSDYKTADTNQYYLAGKYGGFAVPAGFDPDTHISPLGDALWTDGDSTPNFKRPRNFYAAADANRMVKSLTDAFSRIVAEMTGSGSSFAANTTKLEAGAMTYQAQFYGGTWGGELTAYTADVSTGKLTPAWSATGKFPLWGPRNDTVVSGVSARKIFFANGASLGNFEAGQLSGTPLASATAAQINYLRGDRSNELPGALRVRRSVLGDIVNSQPVYVGTPNSRLYLGQTFSGASAYSSFVAANASGTRTPVIYVGANDGMLHAFNANTGVEIFAFVPTASMSKLIGAGGYTDPEYAHSYTVDGDLTVADVYTNGSWKTVLVGSLGRGGSGLFALDVTDPTLPSLLWEKSAADIPALGNNLGQPIVAQVADGDWRVLVGNGPNSSAGRAQLVMVGLANGAVTTVDTGAGSDNGLSGINAWASSGSGFVDTVYGGDMLGNMWKITGLTGAGSATKLFAGGSSQPITATPLVAKNPATAETWVFFGTGRYLSSADIASKAIQSWYGIIDKGTLPVSKANLRSTAILAEGPVNGVNARALESYATAGLNGWYLDLVSPGAGGQRGERMVEPNFFQGLALIGTTRIPDSNDVCSPSGTGFTMAISPFTGGRLAQTFFDVNGDGAFNSGDTLNGVPVSGIGYDSSPNNPIFLGDTMYTGLDDGSSKVIKTNASSMNVRRVSWRELIRE